MFPEFPMWYKPVPGTGNECETKQHGPCPQEAFCLETGTDESDQSLKFGQESPRFSTKGPVS